MQQLNIVEQLNYIYYNYEPWHTTRMLEPEATKYHKTRYENGDIYPYIEDGKVLGYYERYFKYNTCILFNIWIDENCRRGKVFKALRKHFFDTMPRNITLVIGEKQKLGGKVVMERIKHGKY